MGSNLWLIWRDPTKRLRYKVGELSLDGSTYHFQYVNPELEDATAAGFDCYPGFNRGEKYASLSLFSNIKSRLPSPERADYLDMLNEFDLPSSATDWEILTATKGRLVTDDYEFVSPFAAGKIEFDVSGTRHRKSYDTFQKIVMPNDKVYLEPEPSNKYDQNAIKVCLEKNDTVYHLGYVPRFYSKQLTELLKGGYKYSALVKRTQFGGDTHDNDITTVVQLVFETEKPQN